MSRAQPKRPPLLTRLSVQIGAAFTALLLLFCAVGLYTLGMLERQIAGDTLVDVAARLELSAQQLHTQAMQYNENAPRDYPTYYRDLRLYYQNLMAHMATFDRALDLFMHQDFSNQMPRPSAWLQPRLGPQLEATIHALEQTWASYRTGLVSELGDNPEEPRLEYASQHILDHSAELEQASRALTEGLRQWAAAEHRGILVTFTIALGVSILVAVGLMLMLYARTLAPLRRTIRGFQRVADGDFGHRIAVEGSAEIQDLTASFNRLAERLDLLFQLLDRLQRGGDLNQVLGFIADEFAELLRMDWIGVVLIDTDGATARLEAGHLDGTPLHIARAPFPLAGSLVERALIEGRPLRVSDPGEAAVTAVGPDPFSNLAKLGMRDAVVLPLAAQTRAALPAAVIFAARSSGSYDQTQLRFLGNIAHLIAHSFGRTVRLAEQGRLAAIGEFASGIAHELRTPLATITLALEGLQGEAQAERAQRRLGLASQEAGRMARLLEDILAYAKPVALDLRRIDLAATLQGFLEAHAELAQARHQHLRVSAPTRGPLVLADADRLIQVLTNLTRNACEAAPEGAEIRWDIADEGDTNQVSLTVTNPGPPIPPDLLMRLTQPFVTSKATGTGLGLAIVQRLVQAHGGHLEITSTEDTGTCVQVLLPAAPEQVRDQRKIAAIGG